ncbi:hypothetical protein CLOP_g14334 [Closterium sp. NIES-67]|nr:hypothetical protein CLOP_g14334 [Closterium sp. NIES-67]
MASAASTPGNRGSERRGARRSIARGGAGGTFVQAVRRRLADATVISGAEARPESPGRAEIRLRESAAGGEGAAAGNGEEGSGDSRYTPSSEGDSESVTGEDSAAEGGGLRRSAARAAPNQRNAEFEDFPNLNPQFLSPEVLAVRDDLFAQVANWNIASLCDSRQPPLARHPPRHIRDQFASCLLTPLLRLAKDPDSVPAWRLLIFLARLTLRVGTARKPDWPSVERSLDSFRQGSWVDLYVEAVAAITLPPPQRHMPDRTGISSPCLGLS